MTKFTFPLGAGLALHLPQMTFLSKWRCCWYLSAALYVPKCIRYIITS